MLLWCGGYIYAGVGDAGLKHGFVGLIDVESEISCLVLSS